MNDYIVRQGDQYSIPFPILMDDYIITDDLLNSGNAETDGDVEITIGKLRKTLRNGEIKFNPNTYTFDFPLTQEETFALRPGMRLRSQVRVKLRSFDSNENNFIFSYDGPNVLIIQSISKENI